MSDLLQDIELDDSVKEQLSERFNQTLEARLEEETRGLKSKVDELLGEKKRVQQEREEAREQARLEAEEKAKAENNYKQLFESRSEENNQLRAQIDRMNAEAQQQKINEQAVKLAAQLTKDTGRAQLLQKEFSQRLSLVDGELRVTDPSGQLTVSSLDDLVNSIKTDYPFLVDGIQASGGGAVKAQGGAEARGKEMSRSDWEALPPVKRQQFFKDGGKLYDE
jgi:DNA repair exonuclease SbcCD ATPase subunit